MTEQSSLWENLPKSQWAWLFEWGKTRGFPELDFREGFIPKGEENWQRLFVAEQNPWVDSVGFTSEKWLQKALEEVKRRDC